MPFAAAALWAAGLPDLAKCSTLAPLNSCAKDDILATLEHSRTRL